MWRSSDWCQSEFDGFLQDVPIAWKASWSQFDPGKTTYSEFSWAPPGSSAERFILAQRRGEIWWDEIAIGCWCLR